MPIFDHIKTEDFSLIIWEISENEAFFSSFLLENNIEINSILEVKNVETRIQRLASRYVLLKLLDHNKIPKEFEKDEFGKLNLSNHSYHISISHCKNYACAAISHKTLGVDLEPYSDKVEKVAHKFMNEAELIQFKTIVEKQMVWSTKEALYKAYGKKKLIFKDHMLVLNAQEAVLTLPNQIKIFTLHQKKYSNRLLVVCAIEK